MSESHYRFGNTDVRIFSSKDAMGAAAASLGAERIRQALAEHGEANIVIATGASQFEALANLVGQPEIDWHRAQTLMTVHNLTA